MAVYSDNKQMLRGTYPRQNPPKFLRDLENEASNTSRRIRKMEKARDDMRMGEVYKYD